MVHEDDLGEEDARPVRDIRKRRKITMLDVESVPGGLLRNGKKSRIGEALELSLLKIGLAGREDVPHTRTESLRTCGLSHSRTISQNQPWPSADFLCFANVIDLICDVL